MPGYKATVVGEKFEFVVDDEIQHLDFYRTVYVDAEDEVAAEESALKMITDELVSQSLIEEAGRAAAPISVEFVGDADVLPYPVDEDFIWQFSEETDFEEEDWD
jgi:hypothetical protein